MTNPPVLRLEGVQVRASGRTLLQVEQFSVHAGERLALVGPNGAGKSTLLALLAALALPGASVQGRVEVLGRRVDAGAVLSRAQWRAWRAEVGVLMQGLHLVPRLSALDTVLVGALARPGLAAWRSWARLYPAALRTEGLQALASLGLAAQAGQRTDRLSGGERQKVALARLALQRARLVLADEPTAALDPASTALVLAALQRQAAHATLVSVVHDAALLPALADRVVGLAGGRIVFDRPRTALAAAELRALYEPPAAALPTPC
ncbi:MAG: phosphonate ABC transporter ATP-binding protein [Betaproteobacteria bacterium]